MEKPDLHKLLADYTHNLESLRTALPLSMLVFYSALKTTNESLSKFLEKHGDLAEETDGAKKYKVPAEYYRRGSKLRRRQDRMETAIQLLPKKFLVSFVSEYDAFFGRLLRAIFYLKPDILNSSERAMTFGEMARLTDIEEARTIIVEKEVETILRKNHADQFGWLKSKIGVPFKKDLESWATFIELTERRNLFVHCDGEISSQYILACNRHGYVFEKPPIVGEKLGADQKYLERSFRCLYEIGAKLVHVIWRKLAEDEREQADKSLNHVTFDLLVEEEFELARVLLDFSIETITKHSSEIDRRMFTVNRAQSYKWLNLEERAQQILDSEDWTACGDDFQLCVAVLRDDFETASKKMISLGKEGKIREDDYQHWPIFRKFREQKIFMETFQTVFGHLPKSIEEVEKKDNSDG